MAEFVEVPDGWIEVKYDLGPSRAERRHTEGLDALWASNDDQIEVHATHSVDTDGRVSYPVVAEQHIGDQRFQADVQTYAHVADDRKEAEEVARTFMQETNDGDHRLRLVGIENPDDGEFVQFVTISDSELPGEMTGRQLLQAIDNDEYGHGIDALPEEFDEAERDEVVQIDVFPRLRREADEFADDNGRDDT